MYLTNEPLISSDIKAIYRVKHQIYLVIFEMYKSFT
jgi:hypothetical protein